MTNENGKLIGLASTSMRRRRALEQIPDVEVIVVGGGEEANTNNLVTIALNKIAFAYPSIMELCREKDANLSGVVAADTNTIISVMEKDRERLLYKNKPKENDTTRKYFKEMSNRAQRLGKGYYEVASSSAIQFKDKDQSGAAAATDVTKVVLDPDRLAHISTPDGYAEYLAQFAAFYGSQTYRDQGFSPVKVTDLSGGISLPVLLKLGAVESVDGINIRNEKAKKVEQAVKKGLLNAAVGFSPEILKRIHSQAMTYIMTWPWLQGAVEEALAGQTRRK